jgi:hypothetical protein
MSDTVTVKQASLYKRARSHLQPAHAILVKACMVLVHKSEKPSYTAKFRRYWFSAQGKEITKQQQFLELLKIMIY